MQLRTAFLTMALAIACGAPAHAGSEVYRWVDDQGRTQFGDTVPERYQRVARRVDTSGTDLTEHDRVAAEERRQRLQDAADAIDERNLPRVRRRAPAPPPVDDDFDAPVPLAEETGGSVTIIDTLPKRPEPACRAKVRAFEESLACFDQFRNANGTIRPEGLRRCRNVPVPPPCRF